MLIRVKDPSSSMSLIRSCWDTARLGAMVCKGVFTVAGERDLTEGVSSSALSRQPGRQRVAASARFSSATPSSQPLLLPPYFYRPDRWSSACALPV
jgi:hypothetical protein